MRTMLGSIFFLSTITAIVFLASVGCDSTDSTKSETIALATEPDHDELILDDAEHQQGASQVIEEETEFDWCQEHAVPESSCTLCNPSLIHRFKESGDWCGGHGIPESHCRLCNPEISFPQEEILRSRKLEAMNQEIEVSLYFRQNSSVCATNGALIQFASATTGDRAGITVQTVHLSQNESVIDAPAEIVFDETETYIVNSTVPALVSHWLVSPGDMVHEGEALAILRSPEIARLRSSLVIAHANYEVARKEFERHVELRKRDLISQADLDQHSAKAEQTRAELVSVRGLLLSAGLDMGDIEEVVEHGSISNQFVLKAPSAGMVAKRIAQLGELLESGRAFAMLANPISMWIEAKLSGKQMRNIEIGQTLTFGSDGRGLNRVGGEIIWISRFLDPHTRTGTVRARVIDPNHKLHAGEFGRVRIVQSSSTDVVLVPKDAVQWEGCCNVVFVKETDQRYRPHKVELLDGEGPFYQVTSGLKPGEEVVVGGAFLLKTELKKSSIGAGCCPIDAAG